MHLSSESDSLDLSLLLSEYDEEDEEIDSSSGEEPPQTPATQPPPPSQSDQISVSLESRLDEVSRLCRIDLMWLDPSIRETGIAFASCISDLVCPPPT
jgi:hypothetical protein